MIIRNRQHVKNGIANIKLSGLTISEELKKLIDSGFKQDGFIDTEKLINHILKKYKK